MGLSLGQLVILINMESCFNLGSTTAYEKHQRLLQLFRRYFSLKYLGPEMLAGGMSLKFEIGNIKRIVSRFS